MNVSKARNSRRDRSAVAERGRAAAGKVAISFGKMLSTVLLICVLAGCICVCVMIGYILSYSDSRMEIPLEKLSLDYTTTIYAKDVDSGEYVAIEKLYSEENRVWVEFADIPGDLFNAFIAVEDKRFREHEGVDWKRTILSFVNLVVPIYDQKSGGSTITQQLIKNVTGEDDVRVERKIKEIMQAINLEKEYDKDEIILAYVNTIYLGAHAYGVQTASQTYFGKDVGDLTIAECACIAAITQNPTKYNPFVHPNNNRTRQLHVLGLMKEQKLITEAEYEEAVAQEMVFAEDQYNENLQSRQSYFVDKLRQEVVEDMCEKLGWEETYAKNQLLTGGYSIYATVDSQVQTIMDEVYADPETFAIYDDREDEDKPQSAMILMESDGKVVGVVGARGEKQYDMALNYATTTTRQPGSSIKPLTVYSVGIEENLIHYSSVFDDHNLSQDPEWTMYGTWSPKNAYNGFYGRVNVCEAMARSINTIAAQIVVDYTSPELSYQYAVDKYQLSTLVKSQKINGRVFTDCAAAPMTLGALTTGVTLEDMTAAYQPFVNGGYYQEPYYYTEVKDSEGRTVLQHVDDSMSVISSDTSYVMQKLLEYDVSFSGGTCRRMALNNMTAGGKTGTTTDNKDRWVIGFTPYYLGGVWIGMDSYSNPYSVTTSATTLAIWKTVMDRINETKGLTDKPVQEQPTSVVTRYFCPETGLQAGSNCPAKQVGYYRVSNIPAVCTHSEELLPTEDPLASGEPGVTTTPDVLPSLEPLPSFDPLPTETPNPTPGQTGQPVETPTPTPAPEIPRVASLGETAPPRDPEEGWIPAS